MQMIDLSDPRAGRFFETDTEDTNVCVCARTAFGVCESVPIIKPPVEMRELRLYSVKVSLSFHFFIPSPHLGRHSSRERSDG